MSENQANNEEAAEKYKFSFDFIQKKLEGKKVIDYLQVYL